MAGRLRFDLAELSGGLGDLGTFIPLAVSLIAVSGMDAGSVLVFAGLLNVLTGFVFRLPLPVQPMKAIAAVAIAEALAPGEIAAAGFVTGAIVLVLGLTGVVGLVERWVPRPVVRGVQLGVGIKLAAKGLEMIAELPWWGPDSLVLAVGGAVLVLATAHARRFPSALVLLAGGLVLAAFSDSRPLGELPLGWAGPAWVWPSAEQWLSGTLRGALPQVPLTLLNSVIAVGVLSEDLFPGRGVRARSMAVSVGVMNLATCLLGAMPVCHGSGGLAGQYRFGARTGGSVVTLGAAKLGMGLLFGTAAITLLGAIPAAVLGVLLAFAGFELALPARDCVKREAFFTAVVTAAGILAVNTAVGFAVGLVAALALLRGEAREDRPPA